MLQSGHPSTRCASSSKPAILAIRQEQAVSSHSHQQGKSPLNRVKCTCDAYLYAVGSPFPTSQDCTLKRSFALPSLPLAALSINTNITLTPRRNNRTNMGPETHAARAVRVRAFHDSRPKRQRPGLIQKNRSRGQSTSGYTEGSR